MVNLSPVPDQNVNAVVLDKMTNPKLEEKPVGVLHSNRCNQLKFKIRRFINSILIQFLLFSFTLYGLLGDDMRLYFFTKESDSFFLALNIITLLLFSAEIILSSIAISQYFGNFFFWLDLISTLSIITDIEPLWNAITG